MDSAIVAVGGAAGRYELFAELASGGMAQVHLGRLHGPSGFVRAVAIKSMHAHYAKDAEFVSMFLDEARLAAHIRHPNVVPTLDVIGEGGRLLHVMDYVHGASLAELLRTLHATGETVPPAIAASILYDVLSGLHAAHEATDTTGRPLGVVHRDVSPQNVLVGVDGLARVLDFGVAKAAWRVHSTRDGQIKGKVPYMPPEQLFGHELDRTADVYAAAVVLWEMLVGEPPFAAPSEAATITRILEATVPPPSARAAGVTPELDVIVLRALDRDPKRRFSTARDMAEALAACIAPAPRLDVAAWVESKAEVALAARAALLRELERAPPPRRAPRRWPIAIAALVAVGLLASGALALRARAGDAPRLPTLPAAEPMAQAAPPPADTALPPLAAPTANAPAIPSAPAAAPPPRAPAPPPASSVDCRPPFVLDDHGRRHYKLECL